MIKVNEREKRFIIAGVIIALAIGGFYAYEWYTEFIKKADDYSDTKIVMLEKQLNRIAEKDSYEKRLAALKQELETREKELLQGDKPAVAAAAISRILREAAAMMSINIAMERTLNTYDLDIYTAVPVEIGFTATTEKLKEFLYRLRTSPNLLNISELKVRVTNVSNPVDIYTSLVVTGYIKIPVETPQDDKLKADDKAKGGKKEVKDVT